MTLKKSLKYQKIERRQSPRQRLQTMVAVTRDGSRLSAQTENYSLTGLFFRCNCADALRVDDTVSVSFKDEKGKSQDRQGQVVRTSGTGVAVQYRDE